MSQSTYDTRISNLISQLNNPAVVLVVGNGLMSRSADTTFSFRQDSNTLYLTGLQNPGICILIDCTQKTIYAVEPDTSTIEKIFDDPFAPDKSQDHTKYDSVISVKQAVDKIKVLSADGEVYMNIPPPIVNSGVYSNPHRRMWYNKLSRNKILDIKDIRPVLARQRMIKTQAEIQAITVASTVTKQAMKELTTLITSNTTEKELENMFTAYFASQNMQHAYTPIVASGENAAILHHMSTHQIIDTNTCLLLDIGAEDNNYAADISRTYVIGKNTLITRLIDEVTTVQAEVIASIKPGVTMQDLQVQTKQLLKEVAERNNFDESIDQLFPHSMGHHIGLDVHDVADYAQPLAENMVITVEPGLYSKKLGIGIRIEDDVLVTKSGSKIL